MKHRDLAWLSTNIGVIYGIFSGLFPEERKDYDFRERELITFSLDKLGLLQDFLLKEIDKEDL